MWSYGLQLWQQRNLVYHGGTGEVSTDTQLRMTKLADEIQKVLLREIKYDMRWIVNQKVQAKGANTYSNTVAWLDSIRRIYPDKYAEARDNINLTEKFERAVMK